VTSCDDDLTGVWRDRDTGAAYDAIDARRTIELHPMFDSAGPADSAHALALTRSPGAPGAIIDGHEVFWRDGARVRWPASLKTCTDDTLWITVQRDGRPATLTLAPR